jgi:acetylornithine deacetylase/succinyl-diaminopimelate desuccinylase-like protein
MSGIGASSRRLDHLRPMRQAEERLALLITGDEEGVAVNGANQAAAVGGRARRTFGHCIVGEPSSLEVLGGTIKVGRRGSLKRHPDRHRPPGRALRSRRQPDRSVAVLITALRSPDEGGEHFDRRTSNSRRSMSAIGPSTSSRARPARVSISVTTTGTARSRSRR